MKPVVVASPATSHVPPAVARLPVVAVAVVLGLAGFALGYAASDPTASVTDAELTTVLRFMALTKLAMALGFARLVDWRFRTPVSHGPTPAYVLAASLMAAAPGLIWATVYLIPASLVFHSGLLIALVAGLRDNALRRRT